MACFVLVCGLCMSPLPAFSPDKARLSLALHFFGLSFHPHGVLQPELMPRKLDEQGVFVLNVGLVCSFEYFLLEDLVSVKIMQGMYSDCGNLPAGFTHIGLRGRIFSSGTQSLSGGIGPTWLYRRSWFQLDGYDPAGTFFRGTSDEPWQYRFLWYGGEFEYAVRIHDSADFTVSFVPGYPDLMSLFPGVRYRF